MDLSVFSIIPKVKISVATCAPLPEAIANWLRHPAKVPAT